MDRLALSLWCGGLGCPRVVMDVRGGRAADVAEHEFRCSVCGGQDAWPSKPRRPPDRLRMAA